MTAQDDSRPDSGNSVGNTIESPDDCVYVKKAVEMQGWLAAPTVAEMLGLRRSELRDCLEYLDDEDQLSIDEVRGVEIAVSTELCLDDVREDIEKREADPTAVRTELRRRRVKDDEA